MPTRVITIPGIASRATLKWCRLLADLTARRPEWRAFLAHVVAGVDGNDRTATAYACWRWVHRNIRYHREPGEIVQSPAATVRLGIGDCDDQSTLINAMFEGLRLPNRFALAVLMPGGDVGLEPEGGARLGGRAYHIFAQVKLDGRWVCADTIHPRLAFGQDPRTFDGGTTWE
ncbi:MAG: transglutaminase family protein [bacterium]